MSDSAPSDSADRGDGNRAGGDGRSVRRGWKHAGSGVGASLSGSGFVSGDGPVRVVLPLLYTEPDGEQQPRLRFSSSIRRSAQIHRRASGNSRRFAERRGSVVAGGSQTGLFAWTVAGDRARGV